MAAQSEDEASSSAVTQVEAEERIYQLQQMVQPPPVSERSEAELASEREARDNTTPDDNLVPGEKNISDPNAKTKAKKSAKESPESVKEPIGKSHWGKVRSLVGVTRYSRSRGGQDKDDLVACSRFGDYTGIADILAQHPDINVNRVEDELGRSLLIVAVRNDQQEVVESLLVRSHPFTIMQALLVSISLARDNMTELIIRHAKYKQVQALSASQDKYRRHLSRTQAEFDTTDDVGADDTLFSADVTPLIFAAQRNQMEIVKILLSMGEAIEVPHEPNCNCDQCQKMNVDVLRWAKTRLSCYRALASESYITLASKDPLLEAFQMSRKLKSLSTAEKHFKNEYLKLADQVSGLAVSLLDRVRDGEELDVILNERSGTAVQASYDQLARLNLAVQYREMGFVAHSSCQKKLSSIWHGDLPDWDNRLLWIPLLFLLILVYPLLAIVYWVYPYGKLGRFMRTPKVKFWASACSYLAFVLMIIAFSATERPSSGLRLSDYSRWYEHFSNNGSLVGDPTLGSDMYVRYYEIGYGSIVLTIWIAGLAWQSAMRLWQDRGAFFTESWYNSLDVIMISLYIAFFGIRYYMSFRVDDAVKHFSTEAGWLSYLNNDTVSLGHATWINANRATWSDSDLSLISEAIFAIANLLSVTRVTYLLSVNERVGPLMITLARMFLDVLAFMFIFGLVIAAFVIGFHNLYWYYYSSVSDHLTSTDADTSEDSYFSSISGIVITVFWCIFGMVDLDITKFDTSLQDYVTSVTGHVMFAFYNWIMVIILINMLIAMMARSYEIIKVMEDTEWKYARSKLYMEYIKGHNVLCVPFNLMPTWHGVIDCFRSCCRRDPDEDITINEYANGGFHDVTTQGKYDHIATGQGQEHVANRKNKKNSCRSAKYKVVIGLVVQRFIRQWNRSNRGSDGDADGESDLHQLRQDVTNLRRDLSANIAQQERQRQEVRQRLLSLTEEVHISRKSVQKDLSAVEVSTVKRLNDLDASLGTLQEGVIGLKDNADKESKYINREVQELRGEVVASIRHHQLEMKNSLVDIHNAISRLAAGLSETRSSGTVWVGDDQDRPPHHRHHEAGGVAYSGLVQSSPGPGPQGGSYPDYIPTADGIYSHQGSLRSDRLGSDSDVYSVQSVGASLVGSQPTEGTTDDAGSTRRVRVTARRVVLHK